LRRAHPFKKGIRALGIAESFDPSVDKESLLAGVVMRKDLVVDGIAFARTKVGGDDSTAKIASLVRSLERNDINVVMLSGAVISFYNIVDLERLHKVTGLPVVCLTYKESRGLEESIRRHFHGRAKRKLELYRRLGRRTGVRLKTGETVYIRAVGVEEGELSLLLDSFTLQGKHLEPVRVAGLLAAAARSLT
jgi:endonuclease V-like protein UPF0215 family